MEPMFDHEKLDVYRLELQFIRSLSALLNTAEGNGKRQKPIRAKFFDDARGSTTECAACLDALMAKGLCAQERIQEGKALLLRIVQMLAKLIQLYSDERMLREDEEEYNVSV